MLLKDLKAALNRGAQIDILDWKLFGNYAAVSSVSD